MHHIVRAADVRLQLEYPGHGTGMTRAGLVDRAAGAVHTALGLCAIDAGGSVDTHVHSYEEYFYVIGARPS